MEPNPLPKSTDIASIQNAIAAFSPANFGFIERTDVPALNLGHVWIKSFPEIGQVCFAPLSWQHSEAKMLWEPTGQLPQEMSFLDIVQHIQMIVWGMKSGDTISPIEMAILEGTGGYLGVAYPLEKGLTPDTWLGFVLGYGSVDGVLASQMLGTNPKRHTASIGQHLKMLQAYEALLTGHHTVEWTFDPTRSQNAHLNITKLGASVERYIVNKYGDFYTELYGFVPSDRFVAHWQLTSPSVQKYLKDLWAGQSLSLSLSDIETIPLIDVDSLSKFLSTRPPQLKYEIPADINTLTKNNSYEALQIRDELRQICIHLLDAKQPDSTALSTIFDPALVTAPATQGDYRITNFVSDFIDGQRRSFYIFTLKGD